MKPIYVYEHWIGGECIEKVASFDLDMLINKSREYELSIVDSPDDLPYVWDTIEPDENPRGVKYYKWLIEPNTVNEEIMITEIEMIKS